MRLWEKPRIIRGIFEEYIDFNFHFFKVKVLKSTTLTLTFKVKVLL